MLFFRGIFHRRHKAEQQWEAWKRQPQPDTPGEASARTYVEGYALPKDAREDERLRYQHYALHEAFGTHYLAPIRPDTRTILDVGCGTGIWSIEMAKLFPQAQMIGVDKVLTSLPRLLPPSCVFCHADVLEGLPFPDQQFDFTHQRLLVFAIPAARWPQVIQELVRVTRPQGWLELLEAGNTLLNAGPATERLFSWLEEITTAMGIDFSTVAHLGDLLKQAGCQAIEGQDIPVPLGEWAGNGGRRLKIDALRALEALQPRTSTPPEQFEALLTAAAAEWEQKHTSYVFHVAYGRKAAL